MRQILQLRVKVGWSSDKVGKLLILFVLIELCEIGVLFETGASQGFAMRLKVPENLD